MASAPAQIEEQDALSILENMANLAGPTSCLLPVRANDEAAILADHNPSGHSNVWKPDLRYRSLVEKLPVITFMASLDESLQELYISPQIETLLGFTQEEWLDDPILWFKQLHPDDREKWVTEFAETCSTGAHFRAEYRILARDGRVVWVQGECQVIRDEQGNPLFMQGVAFDITHLKRAAIIEEAKLAAEAASRAKSEFLARMSHEIRTPLNGVVGMIDLLRSTELNTGQQRYAQLARESADGLLLVINDILDFSKIEAGKVEIEAIEFDLHKVIEDLTELLTPMAAKKNLALASLLRRNVPHRLVGDPNRIRQVLTNLVNNALKFTSAGAVSIRAWVEKTEAQNVIARVEVEDTGMGIPADRLDRLFKSFSQADTSTTRKFGGTGLGLAISKRLVELMGGEIGIRSQEGKGTTFWFTLRLGAIADQSQSGAADALRNVRLLAIEPDAIRRRILAEQLDGWLPQPCDIVSDDGMALSALRQAAAQGRQFGVALIPYGKPQENRFKAEIQTDGALREIKLIAVMDSNDPTDTGGIAAAGFSGSLHRPFTQSQLFDAIASAIVQRSGNAAPVKEAAAQTQALKGLHLLVAEDNEMNQFVTKETLRRAGCTCDIVSDGSLAVEAVLQRRYDAVLMDCQMPVMDGLEATSRIRQREKADAAAARVPVIALTADAMQGDRERCLAAGMDGYVSKPINAEELYVAIAHLVRNGNSGDETSIKNQSFTGERGGSGSAASTVTAAVQTAGESIAANEAPINLETLLARCMKDAVFAGQTLQKFQDRALRDVEILRNEAKKGDAQNVKRLAHNLKSVAAHVGAGSLRNIAFEIEQAGARADLEFITRQLSLLDAEARRCAAFIPEALSHIAGTSVPAAGNLATKGEDPHAGTNCR